ncbi:hypothetical protein [Variovorax sp. HJSM1_2]|uniref:hypothetical protein n=1 Tax=Variovorax sp. HJSM1_2 TaxID=3366263 RepID=UPI003BD9E5DB
MQNNKTILDQVEQASKIVGSVAVPLLVALFGWLIQQQLASQTVSRDYVQLAVSILKEPKKEDDQQLREWAVELLNRHAPIKLGESVSQKLQAGDILLPNSNRVESSVQFDIVIKQWFTALDSGKYNEAWELAGDTSTYPLDLFIKTYKQEYVKYGKSRGRVLTSIQPDPQADYPQAVKYNFVSNFENTGPVNEFVTLSPTASGIKVVRHSYSIRR